MAPTAKTRGQAKADTREKVRRAALELFTRDGFDATTTKAIAVRARVATGTVFVHARDKIDLLCLVMHDLLVESSDAQFDTLPEGLSLLDELMHIFRGPFRMYAANEALARPFIKHLPGADGPNGERVSAMTFGFLHRLTLLVQRAAERGEIRKDAPFPLAAQSFFALYYFSLTTWLAGVTSIEAAFDPLLRSMIELQIRGLVSQAS